MDAFLDSFFFYESMPVFLQAAGSSYGVDIACLCALPNFFNLILHFVIAALLVAAIARPYVGDTRFLGMLLVGVLFSGASKFIDWTQNLLTATGETIFWSNQLDVLTEVLQLIGIVLILWALFDKLRNTSWK